MPTKYLVIFVCILATSASAEDPSIQCVMQLKDDSKIQILEGKFAFDISKGQPLQMLANKAKPNKAERVALAYLADQAEKCADVGAAWRKENYPIDVNTAMTTYQVDSLTALADLYAGTISYGDAAKIRAKLYADFKNKIEVVASNLKAQREATEKHDQEVKELAERQALERKAALAEQQRLAQIREEQARDEDRRRAALQILSNMKPYVVQPYQMPVQRSQNTSCITSGNFTNCTTN